jgi:tRNA (pseudouridine54-N1)-methyltransferase
VIAIGMREFILRARRGPSTPDFSLDDLPRAGHLEIVAHCLANALFTSNQLRRGVVVEVVLEGPSAPPKTVRFESDSLGSLEGFDERSLCRALQRALQAGRRLATGEEAQVVGGVWVGKNSFERLVRQRCQSGPVYYLQRKGEDLRQVAFRLPSTFAFTDHLAMPKGTDRLLARLGARPLSVGPKSLFASQCIVLVHNELDRLGLG